jgi:hypothetical protein
MFAFVHFGHDRTQPLALASRSRDLFGQQSSLKQLTAVTAIVAVLLLLLGAGAVNDGPGLVLFLPVSILLSAIVGRRPLLRYLSERTKVFPSGPPDLSSLFQRPPPLFA